MIDFLFRPRLSLGLSVAILALSAGIAQAQDDETVVGDDDVLIIVDDGVVPDEVTDEDMIAWSGEIIEDDGVVPGDEGDVEYLVDEPVIDPVPGEDDGILVLEDDPIFVDSECGGCEYTTTDLGGRPVMANARGDVGLTPAAQGWDAGSGVDPFARGNICFSAETYVGFLCDWQRPFIGDMMPAP